MTWAKVRRVARRYPEKRGRNKGGWHPERRPEGRGEVKEPPDAISCQGTMAAPLWTQMRAGEGEGSALLFP